MNQVLNKYSNYKKFYFDQSSNYSKIYLKSLTLITDISGTAYTYAFFTKNPVIFLELIINSEKNFIILNIFKIEKNWNNLW